MTTATEPKRRTTRKKAEDAVANSVDSVAANEVAKKPARKKADPAAKAAAKPKPAAKTARTSAAPVASESAVPAGPTAAEIRALILASLDKDKAVDMVVIDLEGKSSLADCMVVASGTSSRQVAAMAEHLIEKLKAKGLTPRAEGLNRADWVLIDAYDVIVHLFRPEVREFYGLEKMWQAEIVEEGFSSSRR